jgi:hypothetical protein
MKQIRELKIGDSFRTKSGKNTYTIIDIVYSETFGRYYYLLKGGWYVSNPYKEVIPV